MFDKLNITTNMNNLNAKTMLWCNTLSKNTCYLSQKFKLDGKSYKITNKGVVVNMRFNRSNKTLLVLNNTLFKNKNGQKKIYCINGLLLQTSLKKVLYNIRKVNTYTLRGLWLNGYTIQKRVGRVSGY